jgi:hypothetical protein
MTESAHDQSTPADRGRWPLALSGLLPLLGGLNASVTWTLFVAAWFWRRRRPFAGAASRSRFALMLLVCGLLLELLAWTGNYLQDPAQPALFHPQLIPDMLFGFGFYSGWTLAWGLLLRFYRFSLWQMVALMGVYGVIVEQNGAVLVAGMAALPLGVLLWLYVAAAYGGAAGLAYLLAGGAAVPMGRYNHWIKYVVAAVVLYLCVQGTFLLWGLLVQNLGLIPPPRPIRAAPFW